MSDEQSGLSAEERRALRRRIFGDVLPETTADERDERDADGPGGGNDDFLRSNVPPHHG